MMTHTYLEKDVSGKFFSAVLVPWDSVFNEHIVILRRGFLAGHSKCVVYRFGTRDEAERYIDKIVRRRRSGGYAYRASRNVWPDQSKHLIPRSSKPRKPGSRPKKGNPQLLSEETVRVFKLDDDDDD